VAAHYNRPWWELLDVREDWMAQEAELLDVHQEIAAMEQDKWRT